LGNVSPFARLDWLIHNTTHFLKSWIGWHVGNIKSQLEIYKEVMYGLEASRDRRQLLAHEENLRRNLKLKSLARQESWIMWIKEGDAPTHFSTSVLTPDARKS
jgi:hypothetical protein